MRNTRNLSIGALILSILALIVSLVAVLNSNRSETVSQPIETPQTRNEQAPQDLAREINSAQEKLTNIRQSLPDSREFEEADRQINDIRVRLEAGYAQAGESTQKIWNNNIAPSFNTLESEIEAGSFDALNTLDSLIDTLRRQIQQEV